MSSFTRKARITFLKGMEVLGTTASTLASNAKLKVNEINLETRRREILTSFSLQAFELWQKGVPLPEPLSDMLTELSDIEGRLSVLRAQKYAKVADQPSSPDKAANTPAPDGDPVEAAPTIDDALPPAAEEIALDAQSTPDAAPAIAPTEADNADPR